MEPTSNPYRAPASTVADVEIPLEVVPANRGRRFATLLIDYVCFIMLSAMIGAVVGLIWGEDGIAALERLPSYLLGVIMMLLYYIPFEATFGRTIGKFALGTKVVNEEGVRATFGQIVGRSLSRFIPFEAFSFFSSDSRGWHDSIPKTFVVMCR
jgi:uncharacterized RDD family membrane protein YckC